MASGVESVEAFEHISLSETCDHEPQLVDAEASEESGGGLLHRAAATTTATTTGTERAAQRAQPLDATVWASFLDAEGRVVDYHGVKQAIFQGGVARELRKEVWKFLFGYFEFHSTYMERDMVTAARKAEYKARKRRWQEVLEPDKYPRRLSAFGASFEDVQAELQAQRYKFDDAVVAALKASCKQIEKDLPRTDVDEAYFAGRTTESVLDALRAILVTYAAFQPDVGYVQGMDDVLLLMLAVLGEEEDAYYCFSNYMKHVEFAFKERGMRWKVELLQTLLRFMDPELFRTFERLECDDLLFCHRWLLVSFKREFATEDAVRLFEVICTHYHGSTVPAVDGTTEEQKRAERELLQMKERNSKRKGKRGGAEADEKRAEAESARHGGEELPPDMGYTFELFFSLAILERHRGTLMKVGDVSEIYTFINDLSCKMDLDSMLVDAESLFNSYCLKRSERQDGDAWQVLSRMDCLL